jgi:hypothetical protein
MKRSVKLSPLAQPRSCEYCRIREDDDAYSFHVEHIISVKHAKVQIYRESILSRRRW